jgi:hypothetical protein
MPGDLRFNVRGRPYILPVTSTLILSVLAWLIGRLV